MSVKSVEGFQNKLERDLSWRKREISGLRVSALRSGSGRGYLFRSGLVLLCAHWEGFLKTAIDHYVEHVFAQQRRVAELVPVFVALSFFSDVQKAAAASYPGSKECHIKLAERILQGTGVTCVRGGWEAKTEGNPGTEVMSRLLSSVGLDAQLGFDNASWSAMKVYIDEQVVADRHRVAHGDGFRLSKEEFLERSQRMLELLDHISAALLSAAESKSYLSH